METFAYHSKQHKSHFNVLWDIYYDKIVTLADIYQIIKMQEEITLT
jgi:hypothetical protein